MTGRYAETTTVSAENSRGEIERILVRYGASEFMYGWAEGAAMVQFKAHDRHIRFVLPMPDRQAREFTHTPEKGLRRNADAQEKAYEQAVRQRWRALALAIKAKLEAVVTGITTFEAEFLAHVLLPDGSTVGQWVAPQLDDVYRNRQMPSPVLLALEAAPSPDGATP